MSEDLSKFTVKELKEMLRERELLVSGNKAVLIERLEESMYGPSELTETTEGPEPTYEVPPVPHNLPVPSHNLPVPASTPSPSKRGRSAKDPLDYVREKVVAANASLADVLKAVFEAYNLSDRADEVLEALGEFGNSLPPAPEIPNDFESLSKLKVTDLKAILRHEGLKLSGKKDELIRRILDRNEPTNSPLPPSTSQLTPANTGLPVPPGQLPVPNTGLPPPPGQLPAPPIPGTNLEGKDVEDVNM